MINDYIAEGGLRSIDISKKCNGNPNCMANTTVVDGALCTKNRNAHISARRITRISRERENSNNISHLISCRCSKAPPNNQPTSQQHHMAIAKCNFVYKYEYRRCAKWFAALPCTTNDDN